MMKRFLLALVSVAGVSGPVSAHALQDTVVVVGRGARLDSRSRVAREAVNFFNRRAANRIFGSYSLSSNEIVTGDVAVFDGPVRIAGRIRGDLVVINSDLRLLRTADIRGDILVVGGSIRGLTRARVDGNARVYRSRVNVRQIGEALQLLSNRDRLRPRNLSLAQFKDWTP